MHKNIPVGDGVFARKGGIIVFLHDRDKGLLPGATHFFFIVKHHKSLPPVSWQEDASTEIEVFVKMHHFCTKTHVI